MASSSAADENRMEEARSYGKASLVTSLVGVMVGIITIIVLIVLISNGDITDNNNSTWRTPGARVGREEVKGVGVGVNGTELEGREGELQWVWFIFLLLFSHVVGGRDW